MIASGFQLKCMFFLSGLLALSNAFGQDHGRIKRKPPTELEAGRIASDRAMNDSLLRKGDNCRHRPRIFRLSRIGAGWDGQ